MKTAFFIFILFPLLRLSSAQAGWGIRFDPIRVPTIGEVVGTVQKVMPVSPHSVECDRVREDANRYQKQYSQDISRDTDNLNAAKIQLAALKVDLQNTTRDQASILNQEGLLKNFQNLTDGLNANESDLRAALLGLQSKWSDPTLRLTVDEMANKTDDVATQRLATLLQKLLNQNSADLQNLLQDQESTKVLAQLSELVSVSQAFVAQQKGRSVTLHAQTQSNIDNFEQKAAQLSAEISQLTSEIAKQEERKSCKF
jgi:chromosome segregation ATPase